MAADSKSPADLKKEGEELKALFARVKKKQHNCAILMAKDGVVIEAHIKKSPDILVKAGKKNGGMAKGAWGTMTMDGQVIKVDPINDKVPGNLAKLAKKYFSARGLKLRLEILEPEEAEETTEDVAAEAQDSERGGATEEDAVEAAETGDKKEELEKRLADMQDRIDVLHADTENVMYSALQDGLAAHKRAMDGEDYERGSSTLDVLDGVLEDYAGILAEKEPLQARMDAMAAGIERVKKGDNSDAADQIGRFGREFDYALANNEWIGAGDKLDAIEHLTKEHAGAEEEPEEAHLDEGQQSASKPSDEHKVEGEDENDDQKTRDKLARWLNKNKPDINTVLKDKNSKHEKDLTKWIVAYQKALKADDFKNAEQAQNKIAGVIKAHAKDDKLSATQKSAIFDELKNIEKKLSKLVPHIKL